MKRIYIFAFCYLICLGNLSYSQTYVPGQLYIQVENPRYIPVIEITSSDTVINILDDQLLQIFHDNQVYLFERAFPIADLFNVPDKFGVDKIYKVVCNCDEDQLWDELTQNTFGKYVFIEKIPQNEMLYTPDDYNIQDSIATTGPDSALNLINAQAAWTFTKGDSSVKIGIVDNKPLLPTHEDILGKIVYWDTINGTNWEFHGLFIAGCAAGNTDNGKGKSSIGFKCSIIFSSHWAGNQAYYSLLDLSLLGAKVVNASWGHPDNPEIWEQNVINLITANGTLVVSGAGNEPVNGKYGYYLYPASYSNVLSVTSIDFDDTFLNWEGNGTYHHNYNDFVDICAPGYHVLGLWDSCETCYKRSSGTSFASPIVAGTAGLIFSINPCLTPADVTYILKSTANDTIYSIQENQPYIDSLGSGSLDAGAALQLADSLYKARNYTVNNGENITWTVNKYVNEEILIESGGTLTVRSKVLFNKNAKITVKTGGKLIVDGGWLTNNCLCSMWSGIDVYGNRNQSQYYPSQQGMVIFQNGAVVENAITAVRTLVPIPSDAEWAYDPSGTGGIIVASNSTFRNNQRAVLFLPYENFHPVNHSILNNYSYFTKCTFETKDVLNDTTKIPSCFAELNGVRGIRFYGCTFKNDQPGIIKRDERGNGINAINSGFYIDKICKYEQENCTQYSLSNFKNLNYGIKALGTGTSIPICIDHSAFSQNYTGIYLGSIQDAQIIRDTFDVKAVDPASYDTVGGLYLDQCARYHVEGNKCNSNYTGSLGMGKSIGIAVNNSNIGSNSNIDSRIYNNTFEKLNYAILAMNKNRSMMGDTGLSILCNDFDSIHCNEYDISITKDNPNAQNMGIKFSQGSGGSEMTSPAGNTFGWRLPYDSINNPFTDYSNECENIDYWYHYNSNGYHVEPKNHTPIPNVIPKTNQGQPLTYSKNECCPSSFESGGGGIEDLINEKNGASEKIDSIEGLLAMLVDGGDTPGTANYVQTSNSSQTLEVRDDLLSKSPYLSDSVMTSAAAKEDVLPPAIITEILSANPQAAKSDTVMEILENRTNPLSDDQLADIEQGLFITGAKESLETKLAGYISDYSNALNKIILHFKNDSLNTAAQDSVIWFLSTENQLWAKYLLAFEYFAKDDTVSAENTLNNIPVIFSLNSSALYEYQQYLTLSDLVKQLKRHGKFITEVDSAQIQVLAEIMNNPNGVVSGYARNILLTKGEIEYKEPYILPSGGLKSSKIRHRINGEKQVLNNLKVYPNPARNYIIVEYSKNLEPENAALILYDARGREVKNISVNAFHDWLVLPVSDLQAGNYLITLRYKDKLLHSAKFIILQ